MAEESDSIVIAFNVRQVVSYVNHEGKVKNGEITPLLLWFGATPWHPKHQWLVKCLCHETDKVKDFALEGFRKAE